MGSTLYNKAFAVELSHEFYVYTDAPADNKYKINRDIEVVPTAGCAELMRSGRMRFVATAKGLVVFYQAYTDANDVVNPLIKLDNGAEFVFALKLKTQSLPFFFNVTDLGAGYATQNLVYLNAADSSTPPASINLSESLVKMLRPPVFTHNFRSGTVYNGDADVIVYDAGNQPVLRVNNIPFNPDTGGYSVEINITGQPNGYYSLKAYESAPVPSAVIYSTDFYSDAALAKEGVFGVIKIKFNNADNLYTSCTLPSNFLTFQYQFDSREAVWRYFVVVKSVDPTTFFASNHLEMLDPSITFAPNNPPGLPHPTYKVDGHPVVVFTSSAPSGGSIAFNEKVLTTIKLWQKGTTDKILIDGVQNALFTGVNSNRLAPTNYSNSFAEIFVAF